MLDEPLAAARIAHETIWDLHDELIALGRSDKRTRRLLGRAAHVVAVEIPAATGEARRLRALWSEQELLDPRAAQETLRLLTSEMDRIEPQLAAVRRLQNEVAREFRRLVNDVPR